MTDFVTTLSSSFASGGGGVSPGMRMAQTGSATGSTGFFDGVFKDFDFGKALSGGLDMMGAMGALDAGRMDAESRKNAADWSNLQAEQELLNSQEKANSLREALQDTLSAQDVAYAGSGIDISVGTPLAVAARSVSEGKEAIAGEERKGRIAALSHRQQARQLLLDAEAADYGGKIKAFGKVAGATQSAFERGDFKNFGKKD